MSWQEVLNKAYTEGKYIFVDCYTTWCGPCKAMERNVYPSKEVGDYMNKRFISVKFRLILPGMIMNLFAKDMLLHLVLRKCIMFIVS
ncbi:DUF255 domain-containing protein [Chitinophaga sp. Mgbs1]|uniref:DUF255 domain-containing protein n=1 Tax=Chitinophaga solisilvae TaxID=1233460 RepID=A0A9Q5D6U1_9BACT|nr:DUF255 domain-containing protein [Chitinophaga solisilvae]